MKVSLVTILCFGTGSILIYSGIKNYDPRDVIKWGLGGKKPVSLGVTKDPMGAQKDNPDPGQKYPGDQGLPTHPPWSSA